jgi:hypothetical protein
MHLNSPPLFLGTGTGPSGGTRFYQSGKAFAEFDMWKVSMPNSVTSALNQAFSDQLMKVL